MGNAEERTLPFGFANADEVEDHIDTLEASDLICLDLASWMTGVSVEELCAAALGGEIEYVREPRKAIRVSIEAAHEYASR